MENKGKFALTGEAREGLWERLIWLKTNVFGGKLCNMKYAFHISSDSQLKRYRKGGNPNWDVIVEIGKCGINLNWLVNGIGSKFNLESPNGKLLAQFFESEVANS